jgi:hypothetical protein
MFLILHHAPVLTFQPARQTNFRSRSKDLSVFSLNIPPSQVRNRQSTALNMFMGSDGGVLGIGTPELVSDEESIRRRSFCFMLI